jgi:hypothetical protein
MAAAENPVFVEDGGKSQHVQVGFMIMFCLSGNTDVRTIKVTLQVRPSALSGLVS